LRRFTQKYVKTRNASWEDLRIKFAYSTESFWYKRCSPLRK